MLNIKNIYKQQGKENNTLTKTRVMDELIKAIKENNEKEVAKLLKNDSINNKNIRLQYLLEIALEVENDDIIKLFVEKEKDILEKELVAAIENRNIKLVEQLIKHGVNVNYTNDKLQTPLHIAMGMSDCDIVKILVENNANVSAKDVMGRTPIFYTQITGYKYEEDKIKNDKFILTEEDINNMKLLIIHGANIDEIDNLGFSVLHWAVSIGKLNGDEVFKTLFEELGAQVDVCADNGYTPLYLAIMQKDVRIIKILLEHGANKHFENISPEKRSIIDKQEYILNECKERDITIGLENNIKNQINSIYEIGKNEINKKRLDLLKNGDINDIEKLNKKLIALEEKTVKWNEMYNMLYLFINNKNITENVVEVYQNIIKHLNYIKNCYIKKDFKGKDFEGRVDWSVSMNFIYNNLESNNVHYIVKIMGKELNELTKMNDKTVKKIKVPELKKNLEYTISM